MRRFFVLLFLASCTNDIAFKPQPVDMPVAVSCAVPQVPMPDDAMAKLPPDASLGDGMKACLQQILLDKAALTEMQAALQSCR